ncbi:MULTISPECIES: ester cyclase [Staphylococcus]|uniref:Ester cyclase n=3 Tax=Staphylococcus gallinarum TaxID=1293 RepID=A0A418HNC6_STAGA|nr:ester cyclase [Staphylococcus gallinarum]MCD8827231.1 ester cyclase [Staphylococcus gallinarum]RIL42651.1 ester cyclase [Staphylococcus gallinarum]
MENREEMIKGFYKLIENENYDELKEFCHKDFVFYPQIDTPFYGIEGLKASERKNFSSFPGFKMPVKEIILDNSDKAAVYLTFEGKHTGTPFNGINPTGKFVKFSLMMLLKFKDNKIIEKRSHVDVNDIIKQIKK